MQPPNVSRVLNELQTLGLVTRVPSSQDQRRARVTLTAQGRAETTRIGRIIEAVTGDLEGKPEAAEFTELRRLLDVIIDLPQRYPDIARS